MKRMIYVLIFMMSVAFVSTHHSAFASKKVQSVPEKYQGTYFLKAVSDDQGKNWVKNNNETITITSNQLIDPTGRREKITNILTSDAKEGSISFKLSSGLGIGITKVSDEEYLVFMYTPKWNEACRYMANRETTPQ